MDCWDSLKVVLAQVDAVDVVVVAAHVVVLVCILLARHEIVDNHQIFVVGVELSRVLHVYPKL